VFNIAAATVSIGENSMRLFSGYPMNAAYAGVGWEI
jgi:hypothetical protein